MLSTIHQQTIERFRPWNAKTTPCPTLNGFVGDARVLSVYDGDTITVALETEPGSARSRFSKIKIRLAGIDAPEIKANDEATRGKAQEARRFTETWLRNNSLSSVPTSTEADFDFNETVCIVKVEITKEDKYGRSVARVLPYSDKVLVSQSTQSGLSGLVEQTDLSTALIRVGLACPYDGRGRRST
jgi:endonuclease YncB( thermonuclease family)